MEPMTNDKRAFGIYRRLVAAQATNQTILETAQNGGAVTALLLFCLKNKIIDGAIVSAISKEKPFYPEPKLATTPQEIIESAGTRYTYSPNLKIISEATKQNRTAVAFVATPCQIRAIRKMQQTNSRQAKPIKLLIGLMCTKTFTYEGLMINHIQNTLGINLKSITKTEIKGSKITITADAKQTTVPLAALKDCTRNACGGCGDFSSELADISAGSLGLDNWTLLTIRTQIGEQIFTQAEKAQELINRPIREDEPAFMLLRRFSEAKHKRAENP